MSNMGFLIFVYSASTLTSDFTITVTTPYRLLTTPQLPQYASSSTSILLTPSAGHVDSSSISSSVISATGKTSTFSTVKRVPGAWHSVVSSGGSSNILSATTTSRSTTSVPHDPPTGTSVSDPAPELTSTIVPVSIPTSVSSRVSEATVDTERREARSDVNAGNDV
ncbi:hypothetical protein HD554DRAFT_146947 [Boletus coccyginus]|nr:hypothetical protein HD554DRAFT_146947 [Boletus coccyginus]